MRGRTALHLLLLWLAGNSLRMTVLAVPPVLPTIHRDLHLTEASVGALTSLPVVLLAVAAVPGSLLIARVGPRRALVAGLVLVALAGAARGIGSVAAVIFPMTFLMGLGIAVSQPALPSLVSQWFPHRVPLATATYSNGLLIGEILAVSLTAPLFLPLVGGHWQWVLPVWSVPVLLTAVAILLLTRHARREAGAPPVAWWPNWRSSLTWRLGLILGCASITYFGANAFIPDYLKATHHGDLITVALTGLNVGQLPASFLVAIAADRVVGVRWPLIGTGFVMLIAVALLAVGGVWAVVGGIGAGFASGMVLVLSLALPPILTDRHDVHRLSAAMFTISYALSFAGSLLGGAIWDLTRVPATAFLPVAAAGVLMLSLAVGLRRDAAV